MINVIFNKIIAITLTVKLMIVVLMMSILFPPPRFVNDLCFGCFILKTRGAWLSGNIPQPLEPVNHSDELNLSIEVHPDNDAPVRCQENL